MQIVEHYSGGPNKLLRVETEGCSVNIVIDVHDASGGRIIAVEVEPRLPDQQGLVWEVEGPSAVVVHCRGAQIMHGDSPYAAAESVSPVRASS